MNKCGSGVDLLDQLWKAVLPNMSKGTSASEVGFWKNPHFLMCHSLFTISESHFLTSEFPSPVHEALNTNLCLKALAGALGWAVMCFHDLISDLQDFGMPFFVCVLWSDYNIHVSLLHVIQQSAERTCMELLVLRWLSLLFSSSETHVPSITG